MFRSDIVYKLIIVLPVIVLFPLNLHAWARHNLITKYAIQNNESDINSVMVVTEISPDDSINPEYAPIYTNPDFKNNKVDCNKFINYDLDSGWYEGFEGKEPVAATTALEVLINFSDEPDWGMDKNLNLSFAQKFMAGSQGYRHMYYPAWSFHLPFIFIPQGEAPERAEHFFKRALMEYRKGNLYASYRELARSMHYIMDMGQPFHTFQLPVKLINKRSPFNGTVQAIKNYHFAYETFVANILQMEDCGNAEIFRDDIANAKSMPADSAGALAIKVAISSSKMAHNLIPLCMDVFGEWLNSEKRQALTGEEFEKIISKQTPEIDKLHVLTAEALKLTSEGARGLIMLFEKLR